MVQSAGASMELSQRVIAKDVRLASPPAKLFLVFYRIPVMTWRMLLNSSVLLVSATASCLCIRVVVQLWQQPMLFVRFLKINPMLQWHTKGLGTIERDDPHYLGMRQFVRQNHMVVRK
ncbi:hypothetical protein O9992_09080 [Vibrio lentus]|nr:hypothetical protein [Vibrio lentus]